MEAVTSDTLGPVLELPATVGELLEVDAVAGLGAGGDTTFVVAAGVGVAFTATSRVAPSATAIAGLEAAALAAALAGSAAALAAAPETTSVTGVEMADAMVFSAPPPPQAASTAQKMEVITMKVAGGARCFMAMRVLLLKCSLLRAGPTPSTHWAGAACDSLPEAESETKFDRPICQFGQ